MIDLIVHFEDGNTITTKFNGTYEEAEDHYLGHIFNFGITQDRMVRCDAILIDYGANMERLLNGVNDTGLEDWEIKENLGRFA